jgi:hypothetical protein
MKRISYFDVAWDRRSARGALRLSFDDRSRADLRDLSMGELDLLVAMLRVEKPLYYDEAAQRFSTDVRYPD